MLKRVLCLAGATLILGGCHSVAGTWKLAPGQPRGEVNVAVMTLASDGTFTAQAEYGDHSEVMSGYYDYANGELTFETGGSMRTYGAMVEGDELTIMHDGTSARMTRLKRR